MKPRVLLDVDTVLCDFLGRCVASINRHMGTNHTTAKMDDWDIFECLKVPKDVEEKVYDELNTPGVCLGLDVLPGAQDGYQLLDAVANIYIVTSPMRGDTWESERKKWLWNHFKHPAKRVVQTPAKYAVAGDFLIDDRPSNIIRWLESHPHGVGILWKCEASQFVRAVPDRVVHTNDWKHVAELVAAYQETPRTWKP